MIRLALVGAGLIGREHAALITAHTAASLAAICDPSEESAELAARLGVPWYGTFEPMLDEAKPTGSSSRYPTSCTRPSPSPALSAASPA